MSEGNVMPAEIAKALVIAQAKMRRVGHDSSNEHHRYKYTSAEAILEAVRGPMEEAGLALLQLGWDAYQADGVSRLRVRYLLTHSSGASWEVPSSTIPVLPDKGRPWDKAEATALTYSLGYTLRGLLRIPRWGTDDDVDQRDDRPDPAAEAAEAAAVSSAVRDVISALNDAATQAQAQNAWARAKTMWHKATAEQHQALTAAKDQAKARLAQPQEEA